MKKIKSFIRDLIFYIISAFGVYNIYRKRNIKNVLVVVYHDIIPKKYIKSDNYNYNTTITPERFEKQIRYLSNHYTPITLDQFIDWKYNDKDLPRNPVLLTFDDGHKNLYDYGVPIIEKYGFKGVFFINTGLLGQTVKSTCERYISLASSKSEGSQRYSTFRKMPFDKQMKAVNAINDKISDDEVIRYKYMTDYNCRDLLNRGHYIQSHSVNHYILSTLNDDMSYDEINKSKEYLETKFKINISSIAYPFGDPNCDYSNREEKNALRTGYLLGFSGEWWCKDGIKKEEKSYSLPRFGDVNRTFQYFKYLISGYRLPL